LSHVSSTVSSFENYNIEFDGDMAELADLASNLSPSIDDLVFCLYNEASEQELEQQVTCLKKSKYVVIWNMKIVHILGKNIGWCDC